MRVKITIFLLLILTGSCKNENDRIPKISTSETKKKLEVINKTLVDKDRERIYAYIKRHELAEMKENESGLYYMVWGESNGPIAKTGNIVTINYKISFLDGTESGKLKGIQTKEFLVGHGGVESGIEMAVLLMKQGQKGKFIIPPHLGYGLLGKNDEIPPLAVLVFDVELQMVIEN
jgi:FKBP-type peptidyl-prolyl cis-trans isomerase